MKILSAITSILLLCATCFARQVDQRPNILWIVSEDTSPMMGCYGDKFATTPNIDKLATQGIRYTNAFAAGPVCALSRTTLITGIFGSTMGTDNMRSEYPIPSFIKFFPRYLREAGYYTTNCAKKDYNTVDQKNAWNESGKDATYKHRKPGQPFFAVFNLGSTHESRIHRQVKKLKHDPEKVFIPPYNPATPEMKQDWALVYDNIELMDSQVGDLLKELDEAGLTENTIVFYYSDHGGVVARSKRFMFDSGLQVPLVIRFPSKYANIAPGKAGTATDRLVSFEDFAPTLLNIAGLKIPAYMQGKAFLGNQSSQEKSFAFAYRGRIDERDDFVRSIRDKKYRYVRNYMPQKIYGQHVEYQWQARSLVSFENWYKQGKTDAAQSAFWKPRVYEELYDIATDPYNIHNLAAEKQYAGVLQKMRTFTSTKMLEDYDTGFIPEAMKVNISQTGTIYQYAHSGKYPLKRIMQTADMAASRNVLFLPELRKRLTDTNAVVRYWAVTGCAILSTSAKAAQADIQRLLNDPEPVVSLAACSALYATGDKSNKGKELLEKALASPNRFLRLKALSVLEEMGSDAAFALPLIKTLVSNATKQASPNAPVWELGQDAALATQIVRSFNTSVN